MLHMIPILTDLPQACLAEIFAVRAVLGFC